MNENFFDMKKEKQDRIINGLLKGFGTYDYAHASTDEMVKAAGISKGLLFHYFGNKMGAYGFVYDYILRFWKMEQSEAVREEKSFMGYLEKREIARMKMLNSYPFWNLFIEKCEEEKNPQARQTVASFRKEMQESMEYPADFPLGNPQTLQTMEYCIRGILHKHDRELLLEKEPDTERTCEELLGCLRLLYRE